MIRFCLSLTLPFTALFALLLFSPRLLPRDEKVISYFSGCSVACWHGVEPGITSAADALQMLNTFYGFAAERSECNEVRWDTCLRYTWRFENPTQRVQMVVDQHVRQINIYPVDFSLGEAWLALGAFRGGFSGIVAGMVPNARFLIGAHFDESRITVESPGSCPTTYLHMLQMPVRNISIGQPIPEAQAARFSADFSDLHQKWVLYCNRANPDFQ